MLFAKFVIKNYLQSLLEGRGTCKDMLQDVLRCKVLYAFAFILDSRGKIEAFTNVLDLSYATGLNYSNYFAEVRSRLHEIYQRYENKLQGVRLQRPLVAITSSSKTNMWGAIFDGSSSRSRSSYSTAPPAQPRTTPNEWGTIYLFGQRYGRFQLRRLRIFAMVACP